MKSIRSAIALLVAIAMLSLVGCSSSPQANETAPVEQPTAEAPGTEAPTRSTSHEAPADMEDVTELKIEDVTVGDGAEAEAGKTVVVHYTGWLTDGTKFDSSLVRGPLSFGLGRGEVIPGWDEGVSGMKVGGTRILRIPPDMGYGEAGAGSAIPPNATLVFQVELLGVQ